MLGNIYAPKMSNPQQICYCMMLSETYADKQLYIHMVIIVKFIKRKMCGSPVVGEIPNFAL